MRRRILAGSLMLGLPVPQAWAQDMMEVQIKASYLYQFGIYVDWPDRAFTGADAALRIGVLGSPAMVEELRRIVRGRTLKGHPVEVFALNMGEWRQMHMMFVGRTNSAQLDGALDHLGAQPALVVTEQPGALEQGGVVNFVVVDQRVRFEVAPENARRRRLRVSARLLSAAWRVGTRY